MKRIILLVFSITLFSGVQADDYNWNHMDIGLNDDGEGGGPTFTISSDINDDWFARANIMRIDYDDVDVESRFAFFTVGYQMSSLYMEAGLARVDACQYVCGDDSGAIFMVGTTTGNEKLNAKIGIGMMDLLNDTWTVFEADASYAMSDNLSIYLGFMGMDDLGDNTTKLGVRYSW